MRVLIVSNRDNPKTIDALYQISAYFESQGIDSVSMDVTELPDSAFPRAGIDPTTIHPELGRKFNLLIALGGDGTIIHSSRLAASLNIPLLGINFGYLGFLANNADDGLIALVADALAGDVISERRQSLSVDVTCFGDDTLPIENPRAFYVLNEIVVARGGLGHIVNFDFSISGDKIAHMRGDGLVISTATGSTAYALSAGGPVVGPLHRGMVVVPLAPHTLNSRAIVTEHQDVVEMTFEEGSPSSYEVSLFADGDALSFERPVQSVIVRVSNTPITLLNHRNESYYRQVARTFFK